MGKDQEFFDAAKNGNSALFEKLLNQRIKRGGPLASLRRGPGINLQDSVGYSALHYSALNGHIDIVRLLLYHDASPNILDSRGSSALHLAAWAGHQEIVKMLLTHPYKPANPDMQTMENETPLHCAAQHGHTGALTTLLAHGADPNVRNSRNETPLDLAAQYGRLQAVQMLIRAHPELLQSYNIETQDSSTVSSSSSASTSNNAVGPIVTHSALHLASRNGHNNVVEILLAAGVNVNLLTPSGTALHEAALCGKDVVVRTLLEAGADLNATDSENRTALDVLQEFPPHVTKSIISVINNFKNNKEKDLHKRYSSEATNDVICSTANFSKKLPESQNHSAFVNGYEEVHASQEQEKLHQLQENQSLSNEKLSESYIKMDSIKIRKAAPKKPPRRNLSISPTHLQNFFCNNRTENHGLSRSNPTEPSNYSQQVNVIDSINTTSKARSPSWYTDPSPGTNNEITETIPSTTKNLSLEKSILKSYNPNRKLKRHEKHFFANEQFSFACSSTKDKHSLECLKVQSQTSEKNLEQATKRMLSQDQMHPSDHQHQTEEVGISPKECPNLIPFNSCGSISSELSLSDYSLSTDCVEEYIGDEPFAGLRKGSTLDASKCLKAKGFTKANNKEFQNKTAGLRTKVVDEIYQNSELSTTDSESSSNEASVTIVNEKVLHRRKRDRRNKNIRKGRKVSSNENNTNTSENLFPIRKTTNHQKQSSSSSFPKLQDLAKNSIKTENLNILKANEVTNDVVSSFKPLLPQYNEQEVREKLCEIMETFGNSSLNGFNSFWDPDEINQSEECRGLTKLLDKNGLRHLACTLNNNGYDNLSFMNGILDEKDLSAMNILNGDAQKLLFFIKTLPYAQFIPLSTDASLDQWLQSIHLGEYSENFKKHLYNTIESVCGVWGIELQTVLEINKIGHRKRILHSVAKIRQPGEASVSCNNTNNTAKDNLSSKKETVGYKKKNRPAPKPLIQSLEIRSPSKLLIGLPHNLHIKWPHSTISLVTKSLKYEVYYLGSTVIIELRGTETSRKSIEKIKRIGQNTKLHHNLNEKHSEVLLSISHRGVEFFDIIKNETICEHEIRNINCAYQDADDMRHIAYITKDNDLNLYYCHVFYVDNMHLAMEIILTLAESFEVAYQLALRNAAAIKTTE